MSDRRARPAVAASLALLLGAIAVFLPGDRPHPHQVARSAGHSAFIGNVDVTGLGFEGAVLALRAELAFLLEGEVALMAGDERLAAASLREFGIEPLLEESVRRALEASAGGEGTGNGARAEAEKENESQDEVQAGSLLWRVDRAALRERLTRLAAEVFEPPRNAVVSPEDGRILPERDGRMLDPAEAEASIVAWLENWHAGEGAIRLPVRKVAPTVRKAALEELAAQFDGFGRTLLTGYTTYYDESLAGRAANVRLAARLIDGVVLRPGEVFSFNGIVGPRLLERGFRPAPEIVDEEFVEGVGGGICQVSSTLFNAALYADLKIVERYRHSVPLGYVPPGRDATLQYGVMDFRFQNTLDEPVVVRAEAGGGRLRVSLWGREPLPFDVRLTAEEIVVPFPEVIELDPALGVGETAVDEAGAPGKWIIVSKVIRDKETGLESPPEVVSRNYYPPKVRRVRVGPDLRFWSSGG